ncbi:MAG: hypothetical protein M1835_003124, partial [Candelina submexicana]
MRLPGPANSVAVALVSARFPCAVPPPGILGGHAGTVSGEITAPDAPSYEGLEMKEGRTEGMTGAVRGHPRGIAMESGSRGPSLVLAKGSAASLRAPAPPATLSWSKK